MTDHHDFGFDFDDDHQPYDHTFDHPYEDPRLDDAWEHHHDDPGTEPPVADEPHPHLDEPLPVAEAEITEMPDLGDEPVDVFPPALDVGELPEPVDGFPWIDPAGLGAAATVAHDDPVQPEDLAAYAGTDAATWQELRNSDDPATSALAKWWSQQN